MKLFQIFILNEFIENIINARKRILIIEKQKMKCKKRWSRELKQTFVSMINKMLSSAIEKKIKFSSFDFILENAEGSNYSHLTVRHNRRFNDLLTKQRTAWIE